MGRSFARGSIGLYLLFSLAASVAVGYGVYVLIRERSKASADDSVVERPVPVRPVSAPVVAPPAVPDDPQPPAVDVAERDAVEPEAIAEPAKDTVLFGRPGVAGALEPAAVERTIKRYLVRFDRCARKARERDAVPRGEMRLTFVIAADGDVEYVSGKTTADDELSNCVLDLVKKLRFDKSTDGAMVKVVYPIAFVPASSSDDPLDTR